MSLKLNMSFSIGYLILNFEDFKIFYLKNN